MSAPDRDAVADNAAAAGAPLRPGAGPRDWLVSVYLPIEATSAPDAAARFWEYVRELGPAELPVFVSPVGDELAMRPYLLGREVNLDPEEDGNGA